jgi:RNA polymerase sigma factor (sigma-70 family)
MRVRQMRLLGCTEFQTADSPDSALVKGCLAGDDGAWAALLERYGRLIDAVIRRYRLAEDDHADVFQDVCVAIWRDLPNVRDRERLAPWIVTVAGRHSWDARRRLRPRVGEQENEEALTTVPDSEPGPEELMTRREVRTEVRAALATLSERSRRLLESLFFEEELSYAEIARRLQVSQNSIGPLRGRSFKELRAALGAPRLVS